MKTLSTNFKINWIFTTLVSCALLLPGFAKAAGSNPLVWQTIQKGTLVSIRAYDKTNDTYHVVVVEEEAVGPLMSASEDVVKSIGLTDIDRLKKNPNSLVGNQYQLSFELPALSEKGLKLRHDEVLKRKAKKTH